MNIKSRIPGQVGDNANNRRIFGTKLSNADVLQNRRVYWVVQLGGDVPGAFNIKHKARRVGQCRNVVGGGAGSGNVHKSFTRLLLVKRNL